MRKAITGMLEPGTQTPSPAPDLIPAENINRELTLGLEQRTGALHLWEVRAGQ
jgi:hypothetical protein